MSELDKVVAALVATEVTKQLGERNSLPNVKRAAVTAAQWRTLIVLEAWDLMIASNGNPVGLRLIYAGNYIPIENRYLVDAAFNIGAPAKLGKLKLNLYDYPEYFEYIKSDKSVVVRKL